MFDRVEKFEEWHDASYLFLGTAALHAGATLEVDDQRLAATVLAFWPECCPLDWPSPCVVPRSGITRDVSAFLATAPRSVEARYHAERLLLASLGHEEPTADVLVPTDDRARRVAQALVADPADDRTLRAWGQAVGASARTLARAFSRDTGLTFPAWRTALRMQVAVARLAAGVPATDVAVEVGYRTPSAFTAASKRVAGVVPSDVSVPAG